MNLTRIPLTKSEYPQAVAIWERSVKATHKFLAPADLQALKTEIPTYLDYVNAHLWVINNNIIGFSGINETNLEMLFIDPKYFRQGFGTQIIQQLIQEDGIQFVDVNKDNPNALNFYHKNGFNQYAESPTDGQGRNYPIIHMKLKH